MTTSNDDGHTIHLKSSNGDGTSEPIQRFSNQSGRCTLGVRLAPNVNDVDKFQYRLQQGKKMSHHVKSAPLGCEHIGMGFGAIWKMMLQYPLGATCFTHQQCHKLQSTYLPTFLSKMGINRTTSTAVQHGPMHLGGMGVFDLETEQGIQHTKLIVAHLQKGDEVSKMLSISLDHLQLQAGVSWPVLSQPGYPQHLYIDPCYLSHTWEFLADIGTHLRLNQDQWIHPQRTGDRFLMEDFASLPNIRPIQLVHAQRCRLFLGVTTLANIIQSNGRMLCNWVTTGLHPPCHSIFHYPQQARPSPQVWSTWRKLLHTTYCQTKEQVLDTPLGPWHHKRIQQVWNSVIDPQNHPDLHMEGWT
jgi:hypothetical protein